MLFKILSSSLVNCLVVTWQDTLLHIHIFFNLLTAFFCYPQKSRDTITVALYNITADPNESEDLKSTFPDVIRTSRRRVMYYRTGEIPSGKVSSDPEAKTLALENGYWGPWID